MSVLDQFNQIVTDFDKHADFVTVYITEAHPSDGWAVSGSKYSSLKQHKSIEERTSAAKMLVDYGVPCPVVVDTMQDESVYQYAAMPEAMYIIENGIVKLKALGPFGDYNPENLRKWLENYVKEQ